MKINTKDEQCSMHLYYFLLIPTFTMQSLNESASRLFCSGEETNVEEGIAIMDEAVIPCLHLMSRDSSLSQEDRDTMESIRSHWCCCLGQDMTGKTRLNNVSAHLLTMSSVS